MAHKSTLVQDLFVVKWSDPRPEDVAKVVQDVRIARSQVGHQLLFIAIIPQNCAVPSDDTRVAMRQQMDELMKAVEQTWYVVEGSGFRHSILRSALTGVLLLTEKLGKSHVYSTLEEALATVPGHESKRDAVRAAVAKMG